ncbi:hypothetical protein P1X15_29645 [Runella sp. MFBS21]|nr:hypothetical protein [Runella sp. MFBS21]
MFPLWLKAQQADSSIKIIHRAPENWMVWQVKHVSQWIDRYNHERLPDGTAFTDSSRLLYPREQYIRWLFNALDPRLQKNGSASYKMLVNDFIEESCSSKPLLISHQPALTAMVPILVQTTNPQKDTITVSLQKRYRADSVAYWEVERVRFSKGFKLPKQLTSPDRATKRLYLPPNAHEVAFLPLRQLMIDSLTIARLTPDLGQSQSELLQLETLLCQQKLTLLAMLPPTIWIDTQRGWKIQLNDFVRESENSGWLITGLWKQDKTK